MKEGDEWKPVFNTQLVYFEYLVMPFGFLLSSNDWLMMFSGIFSTASFLFLNDNLIYSQDPAQHETRVRCVIYVKAEKCEFHATTISLLGYIFEAGHIQPDPSKINAVSKWEPPTNNKKLQQFLGFTNLKRLFICNYSQIC